MISISERLRARQEPVGDGSGRWRKDGLCQEAADTIDALSDVVSELLSWINNWDAQFLDDPEWIEGTKPRIDAALAKAKGKQDT